MHAYLANTLTWQVKTFRVFIELHGCKACYIAQLVDNREEATIQKQQGALFSTWLLCCRYIAVIQGWGIRQALSESTGFLYNLRPRQHLVWHMLVLVLISLADFTGCAVLSTTCSKVSFFGPTPQGIA